MNDVEITKRINSIYKNALMFYSDIENYKNELILKDMGMQATSALNMVDNLLKEFENAEKEYNSQLNIFNMEDFINEEDYKTSIKIIKELHQKIK